MLKLNTAETDILINSHLEFIYFISYLLKVKKIISLTRINQNPKYSRLFCRDKSQSSITNPNNPERPRNK